VDRLKQHKQIITQSLRDDFEKELRKEHTIARMHFDVADAMAAFDRIFEVAKAPKA